jgi:hypothetical protein
MLAQVHPMCGEVEQAADAIIAGTTNRAMQRAALQWKIEGVPTLREALLQPDPLTATLDTWVLCNQMADYFDKGPGKESLGPASAQAAAACRRMEEELTQIAATMTKSGDVSVPRGFARRWAAEHPIRYSIAGRESVLSRALEQEILESFSFGEGVAEITTLLEDLNRKLDIDSGQVPRQAQWEAELLKLDLLDLLEQLSAPNAVPLTERAVKSTEQSMAAIERLAPAVERVAAAVEAVPGLVTSERQVATNAFNAELTRTIQAVRQERAAALEQLRNALTDERKALAEDLDRISRKAEDHAFGRMMLVAAITLAVLFLAAVAPCSSSGECSSLPGSPGHQLEGCCLSSGLMNLNANAAAAPPAKLAAR